MSTDTFLAPTAAELLQFRCMVDVDALLWKFEQLSAEIREREITLTRLQRQRDSLRAAIRNSAKHPLAVDIGRALLSPMKGEPTPGEQQAADVIRRDGGTVDRAWLADRLNITLDAANIRLSRAHAKGLLERVAKGRYRAIAEDALYPERVKRTAGSPENEDR